MSVPFLSINSDNNNDDDNNKSYMKIKREEFEKKFHKEEGKQFDEKFFNETWDKASNTSMTLYEVTAFIQPIYNRLSKPQSFIDRFTSKIKIQHDLVLISAYMSKYTAMGGDGEYWTSGAGSPDNANFGCTIL